MLHFFKKKPAFITLFAFFTAFSVLLSPVVEASSPAVLQRILNNPSLSSQHTGVRILSMKTGQPLLEKNVNTALMPASNMKVITSAAALSLLKPEFQFKTVLFTDGQQRGNVLQGNLYLKGYGDPVLNDERLYELIRELNFLGFDSIEGDLVLDDSFFDAERTGRGWKKTYGAAAYSARISALALNLNTVDIRIRPTQVGRPAAIELKPANSFFKIQNNTRTSGGRTRLKIVRQLVNGQNVVKVSGNVYVRGRTEVETINLDKPSLYVGNVAAGFLKREHIQLKGKIRRGVTPNGSRILASSQSPPLREIVSLLNKKSVNLIAENLLKFLGANFAGAPGTSAKGAQVIQDKFLVAMVGLPRETGIEIADGSGLSPLNRLTPKVLTEVLQYMFMQFDVSVDFLGSMAISGVDGTLKKRMNTPLLKRRVRAKTGFIQGASSLSGYLYTQDNEVLIFSFLMNHYRNYYQAIKTQEELCKAMTQLKH